jgi:hypothetical protein
MGEIGPMGKRVALALLERFTGPAPGEARMAAETLPAPAAEDPIPF